jgi:hypothetical protein
MWVAVLGPVVNVSEDAKPELGIFVQDFALGYIVAEMRFDEIVVFEHVFDQGAYLLAPLDTRILFEDPVTLGRKLIETISH